MMRDNHLGCAGGSMQVIAFSGHIEDARGIRAYLSVAQSSGQVWRRYRTTTAIWSLGVLAGRFADSHPQESRLIAEYLMACSGHPSQADATSINVRSSDTRHTRSHLWSINLNCTRALGWTRQPAAHEILADIADDDDSPHVKAARRALEHAVFIEEHEELLLKHFGPRRSVPVLRYSHETQP
ncbi:MAG: hypothetical protein ACE366_15095 [Bradymonadia bacterium]